MGCGAAAWTPRLQPWSASRLKPWTPGEAAVAAMVRTAHPTVAERSMARAFPSCGMRRGNFLSLPDLDHARRSWSTGSPCDPAAASSSPPLPWGAGAPSTAARRGHRLRARGNHRGHPAPALPPQTRLPRALRDATVATIPGSAWLNCLSTGKGCQKILQLQ